MNIIYTKTSRKLILAILFLAMPLQVLAEGFSVTPLVGFRISDSLEDEVTGEVIDIDESSSFGVILSMAGGHDTTYDLYFSRQETDLIPKAIGSVSDDLGIRIDYIHIGGTVDYEAGNFSPFVTGGLGVTRISATDQDTSTENKFSLSIGGGVKAPITKNVSLRLESRLLGTSTGGDNAILCSNGQCLVKLKGSVFLQLEVSLGVSIAF